MATFDSTTHMERQLSSLFRAEAQDMNLPLGTWQAILPRMGEPDKQSLLFRIREAFTFPRWRNPMNIKYVAPAATIALAAIAAILFVLLSNSDADENGPVPASTPTAPPPTPDLQATVDAANDSATATAEAIPTATPAPQATATNAPQATATSVPQPTATSAVPTATATRVPIPTPAPTATPFPPVDVPVFADPDPATALAIPDEINPELEPQAGQVVVDAWEQFFAGSWVRIVGQLLQSESGGNQAYDDLDAGNIDIAFCNNGFGVMLGVGDFQDQSAVGEVFTWSFSHSPADPWSASTLRVQTLNPTTELDWGFGFGSNGSGSNTGQPALMPMTVDEGVVKIGLLKTYLFESADVGSVCSAIAL